MAPHQPFLGFRDSLIAQALSHLPEIILGLSVRLFSQRLVLIRISDT